MTQPPPPVKLTVFDLNSSTNALDRKWSAGILELFIYFYGVLGMICSSVAFCNLPKSLTPHLVALLGSMLWFLYGLQLDRIVMNVFFVTLKGTECFVAVIYMMLFAKCLKSWNHRRKIYELLMLEILIVSLIAAVILSVAHGGKLRSHIFGIIAMICHLGTFATPITAMKSEIATGSLEQNKHFVYASFLNHGIWTAWAIVPFDIYLFVPNVVGLALGMVQIIMFSFYRMFQLHFGEEERGCKRLELRLDGASGLV